MKLKRFNIREEQRIAPEAPLKHLRKEFACSLRPWSLAFGNRDDSSDQGAVAVGLYLDRPAKLGDALLHAGDANSGTNLLHGHSPAVILNFES
jgi:hypothetical protein